MVVCEGPAGAKLALVGEAPGADEIAEGRPFVGEAGKLLNGLLHSADVPRIDCRVTSVFDERPPGNRLLDWCVNRKEAEAQLVDHPTVFAGWGLSPLATGKYMPAPRLARLAGLAEELAGVHCAVALGNTALWALCRMTGVKKLRGSLIESALVPGLKVVPTFHPAAFLHGIDDAAPPIKNSWRISVVADLMKAKVQAEFQGLRLPRRDIICNPPMDELAEALRQAGDTIAVDIETSHNQISCIGVALSPNLIYVMATPEGRCPGPLREALLQKKLIFQNAAYDLAWLAREWQLELRAVEDTMVMHSVLYAELPKSLEFLGSLYTSERPWKAWAPGKWKEGKDE